MIERQHSLSLLDSRPSMRVVSPGFAQISNRLELEGALQISPESIYLHVYADKRNGGDLHQHLRSQKPRRKRYASGQERRGTLRNRVSIDERPDIVAQRARMGDWVGDTVIGKNHEGGLVTLAERLSRYLLAGHIRSKHAAGSAWNFRIIYCDRGELPRAYKASASDI